MTALSDDPRTLVSTGWLAQRLSDPDLRLLDASWHLPAAGRDPYAEYRARRIPGARFFDIEAITDQSSPLPHMAPPPETFAAGLQALGVGDGHQVVIYDSIGVFSAPRVWWTFRLMGKRDVAVLDGGLAKWLAEGRPTENTPTDEMSPAPRDRPMTVARQDHLVKDATQVADAARLGRAEIIDARAAARFRGEAPEPRPGLRAGHIPGAKNLPYTALLAPDGTMKPAAALRAAFEAADVDLARPAITTCGSGITAAILSLALERIGHRSHALYDGSWAEWGLHDDLAIEKG